MIADLKISKLKSMSRANDNGSILRFNHPAIYQFFEYGQSDTEAFILRHRQSSLAELKAAARNSGNETNFKGGMSLFDDLEAIVVRSEAERKSMIRMLKSNHGLLRWPDGRKVEDIVRVKGNPP